MVENVYKIRLNSDILVTKYENTYLQTDMLNPCKCNDKKISELFLGNKFEVDFVYVCHFIIIMLI